MFRLIELALYSDILLTLLTLLIGATKHSLVSDLRTLYCILLCLSFVFFTFKKPFQSSFKVACSWGIGPELRIVGYSALLLGDCGRVI